MSILSLAYALSLSVLAAPPDHVRLAPGADSHPDADALVVRQHVDYQLLEDGRVIHGREGALKVFTGHVLHSYYLDQLVDWNDRRAALEILEVVTWRPDGTAVWARPNSVVQNTAAPLALAAPYAHMRQVVVSHVAAEPGSTSALSWRVEDREPTGVPLWGTVDLQGPFPVLDQRVRIRLPAGVDLGWGVLNGEAAVVSSGDGTYVLERRDVAPANKAEGSVGLERLVFSTAGGWGEVQAWLSRQVEQATVVDDEIRRILVDVAGDSLDRRERVARLHGFVNSSIRAVAWPLEAFDFQPRAATDVLASSLGHGLDKAVLLAALLREDGVEAHVALAGSRLWLPDVPSPTQLGEAWVRVAVDGEYMWLDPLSAMGARNASHLAGRPVLVLDGVAEPVVMADLTTDSNRAALLLELTLAAGKEGFEISGTGDLDLLARYDTAVSPDRGQDLVSPIARSLARSLGGLDVKETRVSAMAPGRTSLRASMAGTVEPGPAGLLAIPLVRVPGALRAADLAAFRERRTMPVELPGPLREEVAVVLTIPGGLDVVHLPPPVSIRNEVGDFLREISRQGDELTIRSTLEVDAALVSPDAWPHLRALLAAAEAPGGAKILLFEAGEEE